MAVSFALKRGPLSCPGPLARLGALEVRLAGSEAEREAAYRLRYQVFHAERGVNASWMDHARAREADAFDPHCEHLIVVDTERGWDAIVGTYRLMPRPAPALGYYAGREFDLAPLFARHPHTNFCEVGRSCVAPDYRSMRTIEALWCGLWAFACRNGIDAYFGAASFPGADPSEHARALAYLYHHARADAVDTVTARPGAAIAMDRFEPGPTDRHTVLRSMPPLVRGYLRVNAVFAGQAWSDPDFGTTDVFVLARLAKGPKAYRDRLERVTGERLKHPDPLLES